MAGLLYLPRLFVYHAGEEAGSDAAEIFKVMERRLLRGIMNPAMVASFIFGSLLLLGQESNAWASGWLLAKLAAVAGLAVMHGLMARWRRLFAAGANRRPQSFYRAVNEVPTVLMVAIVVLAVVKPF